MSRRRVIMLWVAVQDFLVGRVAPNPSAHRKLFAPGFENHRWVVGRWRAWRTFELARRRVPAYREYLAQVAPDLRIRLHGWVPDLSAIPEMDKASYIRAYGIEQRCLDGRLPRRGVVADESSGSSGSPTNWVRGRSERTAVRQILQATFSMAVDDKPIFVLNAFSLGAWATGMNVSTSLADVCIIKSTGPDMTKIIDTMQAFGSAYAYVIMGYPPFLKNLADDPRIDLRDYEAIAGFGGEGLSENMRAYLLGSFRQVIGSYGASDLEINMAVETQFTIALRQELCRNAELCAEVTDERHGVMPMVFQFNPFAYVFDTNAAGELIVTICRRENLSPRINYNIHDRGHVIRMPELTAILKRHGAADVLAKRLLDLPVLLHYGRSDLSVDFYGATLAPDSIRDVVYAEPPLSGDVSTYRMVSYEDHDANKQLLFAIELKQGVPPERYDARDVCERAIAHLCRVNGDFEHAYGDAKPSTRPTLTLYEYGTGPFEGASTKLKNEYVWQIDAAAAVGYGILDATGGAAGE